MIKKLVLGAGMFILAVGATQAMATDSQFGTTSTDSITVNATLEPVVRVSGLQDTATFDLGAAFLNANHNIYQNVDFCVYSNVTSAGSYTLSANSDKGTVGGTKWALQGGATGTDLLAYTIKVSDTTNMNDGKVLAPTRVFPFSSAARTGTRADSTCTGGMNTTLQITFNPQDALAANAGNYTGVLTLTASAT